VSRSGIPLSAAPETHELVLAWMAELPRGRVLDTPSGRGALAHELAAMGFEVVAADLGGPSDGQGYTREKVDLNRPLPFADASFDAVACVEGIEHLERPVDALREFRRVLKPGGALVLTTPNVLHVGSRAQMLLTGLWTSAPRPFDAAMEPTGMEHIMLLPYPMLEYYLRRAGFEVQQLETNRIVRRSLPWVWLAPIVWAATRLKLRRSAHDKAVAAVLTDRRFLFGHTLCFLCKAV
jgi:SAM-dependent methyltransferase